MPDDELATLDPPPLVDMTPDMATCKESFSALPWESGSLASG
jgi:hypothetical protein